MDFKFRRESITANNDTAPVNGIGLNTPDGIGYLSAESGELKFKGEAIGGGALIVTVDMATMTASHSFSEIRSAMRSGQNAIAFSDNGDSEVYILPLSSWTGSFATFSLASPIGNGMVNALSFWVYEDKTVTMNVALLVGEGE